MADRRDTEEARDRSGQHVEVGDVVKLLGVDAPADYALVEGLIPGGTVMVRRFDREAGQWHTTRRRWSCERMQRDLMRGQSVAGQRGCEVFVDRLREW